MLLNSICILFPDDFQDTKSAGPPYLSRAPGRRPNIYNQNFRRPQVLPAQPPGGHLNRGPLLNDLVFKDNANPYNINRHPSGGQNRQNLINQQRATRLQNRRPNRHNLNRNPNILQSSVPILGRPVRLVGKQWSER